MNKTETKMAKDAINFAILNFAKEHVLQEMVYLSRLFHSKVKKERADEMDEKIGTIVNAVERLFTEAGVVLSFGNDSKYDESLVQAVTDAFMDLRSNENNERD